MFKVGLTGGIGSGKTTVAKVFEMLGIPVYYADERAKELMLRDDLKQQIETAFGKDAYTPDGKLDRTVIAKAAFGSPQKLGKLNSIVHPAVGRDFLRWADIQDTPYVIEEAAVLIESGSFRMMDKIIVIEAPSEKRIQRVIERDGLSREAVQSRIDAQIGDSERISYSDYLITADDEQLLLPQIVKIDSEIRKIVLSLQTKNQVM